MPFTIRIELHQADRHKYDDLHDQMEAAGFVRKALATDGVWYDLLPGEYRYEQEADGAAVRTAAKEIAQRVQPSRTPQVFVTEGTWWGCDLRPHDPMAELARAIARNSR